MKRARRPGDIAIVLALAGVYFAAAKLGLSMAFVAEQVTAVWPPTGIAFAAVLLFGEIVVQLPVVDDNLPGAVRQTNASDRSLAAPGAQGIAHLRFRFGHANSPKLPSPQASLPSLRDVTSKAS